QRREGVGPVGLARPDVGVAPVRQLDDRLPLGVEGEAVERDGHAVALHAPTVLPGRRRRRYVHSRAMVDWLAVARRVPSSAQRWTRPWAKPRSTAWTSMSISTHSVGTRRTTRRVLSRLLPPTWRPSAW